MFSNSGNDVSSFLVLDEFSSLFDRVCLSAEVSVGWITLLLSIHLGISNFEV